MGRIKPLLFMFILTFLLSCIDCNAKGRVTYHPIVVDGTLIGGYGEGTWWDYKQLVKRIPEKEIYQIYSLKKLVGKATGEISKNDASIIKIDHPECQRDECIAISCNWNALPREPKVLNSNNTTYRKIVSNILHDNQVKDVPINIHQIIKVDLEGDGFDEVIIAAQNTKSEYAFYNNDYSFLLIRKLVHGKVQNIFVEKDIIITNQEYIAIPPVSYNIRALIDADGDGILELIVQSRYYEGSGYLLYKLVGNKFKLVLENVIGA